MNCSPEARRHIKISFGHELDMRWSCDVQIVPIRTPDNFEMGLAFACPLLTETARLNHEHSKAEPCMGNAGLIE